MNVADQAHATTPEAKRTVVERIFRAWLAAPHLRFGQLLVAACEYRVDPVEPFHVEDEVLVAMVEEMSPPEPHDLTSSEIGIAKMLAAWEEWPGAADWCWPDSARFLQNRPVPVTGMLLIGNVFTHIGLAVENGQVAANGRAILDRAKKAGVL